MNTDAFLLVGTFLKDGSIKKIKFGKKYFKVRFKDSKKFIPYEYDKGDIAIFLQDIEEMKK